MTMPTEKKWQCREESFVGLWRHTNRSKSKISVCIM